MSNFLAASKDKNNSKIALLGIPFDNTSTFRNGSQFAPDLIRLYSDSIETYSPYQNYDLNDVSFYDYGNIKVFSGDTKASLKNIETQIGKLLKKDKLPISIGGEHLITLSVIKALKKKYNKITLIQFDAHTDLRDDYEGVKLSHATVMKRIMELTEINLIQIGIRSGTREEFNMAKKNGLLYNITDIDKINRIIKNTNVYITIDLDVFDPAYMPGVGNPEAGGINFPDFINFLLYLKINNLIGIDVVELIPHIDTTYHSTIFAAKLIRELLIFASKNI